MCRFLGGRTFSVLLGKHKDTIVGSYEYACCLSHSSCPTLCNPRTVAHQDPLSKGFSRQKYLCLPSHFSCVRLCAILWTVACQAPLSMRFSRQEHWCGLLPFPSPGDPPDPETEPPSLMLQVESLPLGHPGSPISPPPSVVQIVAHRCLIDVKRKGECRPSGVVLGALELTRQ